MRTINYIKLEEGLTHSIYEVVLEEDGSLYSIKSPHSELKSTGDESEFKLKLRFRSNLSKNTIDFCTMDEISIFMRIWRDVDPKFFGGSKAPVIIRGDHLIE